MKATQTAVRVWLLELMARQKPQSKKDADNAVRMALPIFAHRFPAAAFCASAQDAIVSTEPYWNEAKVSLALEQWCRLNLASADTSDERLPEIAVAAPISRHGKWLYGQFLLAEHDGAAVRAIDSLRYTEWGHDFDWVVRNDPGAAAIAVRRGWRPTPTAAELAADWDDLSGILDHARRVAGDPRMLALLVRLVHQHAPHFDADLAEAIAPPVVVMPVEIIPPPPTSSRLGLFG